MKKEKTAAVVLAAGRGTRMHSDVPKQYMLLEGRPLICYALKVFQDSFIDEIVLVTEAGEEARCRQEIVEALKRAAGRRSWRRSALPRSPLSLQGAGNDTIPWQTV